MKRLTIKNHNIILIEKPSKIDKYEYRSGEETLTSGPS